MSHYTAPDDQAFHATAIAQWSVSCGHKQFRKWLVEPLVPWHSTRHQRHIHSIGNKQKWISMTSRSHTLVVHRRTLNSEMNNTNTVRCLTVLITCFNKTDYVRITLTLRCVRDHWCHGTATNVTYLCVCVCVCMPMQACSLAYPACNSYAPYCDVICDPSGSTIFFDIISYRA